MNSQPNTVAIVYSQLNCPGCSQAKSMLRNHGYTVEERLIDGINWTKQDLLNEVPDARTVPQIIIRGTFKGSLIALSSFLLHSK